MTPSRLRPRLADDSPVRDRLGPVEPRLLEGPPAQVVGRHFVDIKRHDMLDGEARAPAVSAVVAGLGTVAVRIPPEMQKT